MKRLSLVSFITAMVLDSMAGDIARCAFGALGVSIGVTTLILVGSLADHLSTIIAVSHDLGRNKIVAVVDPSLWLTQDADRDVAGLRWNLDRIPSVARVSTLISVPYQPNPEPGRPASALLIVDATAVDRSAITFQAGRWIGESERSSTVLGSDFAAIVSAESGQQVALYGSSYQVVGVLKKSYSFYDTVAIISPSDAADLFFQTLPHAVTKLPSKPLSAFALRLAPNADSAQIVRQLNKLPYLNAYDPLDRLREFEGTFALLRSILNGCIAIGIVVSMSSIFNSMAAAVRQRVPEIGLRLALGATRSQIFLQFLIEAVILGIAGSVVGIVVAAVLGTGQDRMARVLGWSGIFVPTSNVVLIACVVCIVSAAVAGALPARNAARLEPVIALGRRAM